MTRKHLLALLKSFIAQYDLDLQNVVNMLGGRAAPMRLQKLSFSKSSYQHLGRVLNRLCGLLSPKTIIDINSDDSTCFARLDPAGDVVWAICVLTDIAQGLLNDFHEFSETSEIDLSEVAA